MKVTVYETFENMRMNMRPFQIDNATKINKSKTEGWSIETETASYAFPVTVFIIVE